MSMARRHRRESRHHGAHHRGRPRVSSCWTELLRVANETSQTLDAHRLVARGFVRALHRRHGRSPGAGVARTLARSARCRWASACSPPISSRVTARTAGFNTIDIGAMTRAGAVRDDGADVHRRVAGQHRAAASRPRRSGSPSPRYGPRCAAVDDTAIFKRRLAPDTVAKAFFVSLIAFRGAERRRVAAAAHRGARPADDAVRDHVGLRHRGAVDGRERARRSACRRSSRPPASCS